MDITGQEQTVCLLCPNPARDIVATSGAQCRVGLKFTFEHIVEEYCDNVLVTETEQREHKSFNMDKDEFTMNSVEIIYRELRDWPFNDEQRQNLSELVSHSVEMMVNLLMSTEHKVLIIPYQIVMITKKSVGDEKKMKTISWCEDLDDESCSICLENLFGDCDDEVVSTPCSHNFHENCIKKWLRSSHTCPMCRFQIMPSP